MCIRDGGRRRAIRDRACGGRRVGGLSLIELLFFIVIVGVAIVGVLSVLNYTAARSADPLVRKQVLALAEGMLEEVRLMPFTYCDPDDPAAATATSAGACSVPELPGPEGSESRLSPNAPFDNVDDYHQYSASPPTDLAGSPIAGLGSYGVRVEVFEGGLGLPNDQVLRIDVTATGPGESVTVSAFRTRYAPNALP